MRFGEILIDGSTSCGCPAEASAWVRVSGLRDAAAGVLEALGKGAEEHGIGMRLIRAGSLGLDDLEPLMTVSGPGRPALLYHKVIPAEAFELVDDYLTRGRARSDRALCTVGEGGIEGIPARRTCLSSSSRTGRLYAIAASSIPKTSIDTSNVRSATPGYRRP